MQEEDHSSRPLSRQMKCEGVLHLPAALFVEANALSKDYQTTIGSLEAVLRLPSLPDDEMNDSQRLRLMPPEPQRTDVVERLRTFEWGYVSITETRASYIESTLVTFTLQDIDETADTEGGTARGLLRSQAFVGLDSAVEQWFSIMSEWVEVWTGQRISAGPDPRAHSTRVDAWEVGRSELEMYGTGVVMPGVRLQFSDVAASEQVLRSACLKAARNEPLPMAHRMLRRAREALEYDDRRRAVIDGATAAEAALSLSITSQLQMLSSEAIDSILAMASGLVELMKLHECLTAEEWSVSRRRAMDQLARPRNEAVHAAVVPDRDSTDRALEVANRIVDECSPVPSP